MTALAIFLPFATVVLLAFVNGEIGEFGFRKRVATPLRRGHAGDPQRAGLRQ